LVVPPGDVSSLRTAIESVLADPAAWRRHARTAAATVRRRFGSEIVCEKIESLYWSLVERQSSALRMGA
jgi:glycosyltransferase involved in cell wall biosynthesis